MTVCSRMPNENDPAILRGHGFGGGDVFSATSLGGSPHVRVDVQPCLAATTLPAPEEPPK